MFQNASNFDQQLNDWSVNNVITMEGMFQDASTFNQPLYSWEVSNVKNMESMFEGALIFNQDISSWKTSNVSTMKNMFNTASNFDQSLNDWSVNNVTTMEGMFQDASMFNQPLNDWSVNNVTTMEGMFQDASMFNQPLNDWTVSKVTTMKGMFKRAYNFDRELYNWKVNNVTSMESMFENASSFNQDISSWIINGLTTAKNMFKGASKFNNHPIKIIGSNLKSIDNMFENAIEYNKILYLDLYISVNLTTLNSIFKGATNFNSEIILYKEDGVTFQVDEFNEGENVIVKKDFNNITEMKEMFQDASNFVQDITNWNMSKIENMDDMLNGATNFDQNISQWKLINIRSAKNMLSDTSMSLTNIEEILSGNKKWGFLSDNLKSTITIKPKYLSSDPLIELVATDEPWWFAILSLNAVKVVNTTSRNFNTTINEAIREKEIALDLSNNPINNNVALTSEGTPFLASPRYGFLSINDYQNDYHDKIKIVYNNNITDDNIISKINLTPYTSKSLASRDSAMLGLKNKIRNYINPVNIDKLVIRFYDEYGRIIDLNNMDWSFTLVIEKELTNNVEIL